MIWILRCACGHYHRWRMCGEDYLDQCGISDEPDISDYHDCLSGQSGPDGSGNFYCIDHIPAVPEICGEERNQYGGVTAVKRIYNNKYRIFYGRNAFFRKGKGIPPVLLFQESFNQ